jgi:addiction module antitoxin, relB/dinJ family
MAEEMLRFSMDADLKRNMEETCRKMGLTMADAFTMFAVKVVQDQRIPFEITAEPAPYYS